MESQSKFFSNLFEQLKYLKFIKINSVQSEFNERLDNGFNSLYRSSIKNGRLSVFYSSSDSIISMIMQVILFTLGGIQIINGNFTIGMFTIFSSYFNMMTGSVKYFFNLGKTYQNTLVSYNRIMDILAKNEETKGSIVIDQLNYIETENLCFSFNGNDVLNNVNMKFELGNIYGILGPNGAGKSTLINILLGLYIDEKIGQVNYNGIDIKNLDLNIIRKKYIGVSEQETVLLNDTIKCNMFLGSNTDEIHASKDIEEYLNILDLKNYVNDLPDGINTVINDKNNNVSGGEKQKISILKVLIKNPTLMILDEPTSALDAKSKEMLVSYLKSVKNKKIIIIVSHDHSLNNLYDYIYNI